MRKLGVSVYLDKTEKEEIYIYLKKAATYGFTRIFTCFLSIPEGHEKQFLENFKEFTTIAHNLNFEVSVDTNPLVFSKMNATPANLKPFANLGIDIIRLDGNFGGLEDLMITYNPYNIKIEFNASNDMGVELLIKNGCNKENITMCHNFFPERYTGLDFELFMDLNRNWKKLDLPVATFVSSNEPYTFGPWDINCGLPTIEIFRGLPVELQARYIFATGNVDDIIIGNYPASDSELKALSTVNDRKIQLRVNEVNDISEIEKTIMYEFRAHMDRHDHSSFMIRSSWVKGEYGKESILPRENNKKFYERGDVLIVNDNLMHYRGELQIILTKIPNEGDRNLIGQIRPEELMLLDFIKPGHIFQFLK